MGVADWPAPPGAGAGTGTVGAAPVLRGKYFIDNGLLLLRTSKVSGYPIRVTLKQRANQSNSN